MKCFKGITLLFLIFISFGTLHAEENKPPSAIPWYSQEVLESPFSYEQQFVDTTHTAFQLYDFFSPDNPLFSGKGNVGHTSRLLTFQPDLSTSFPLFLNDPYRQYRVLHNNLQFYRPEHIFTDLFYVTGANSEQLFYGLHSQRFQEKLYISGKYRLINSPGEYSRMGSRHTNVYLSVDYRDPSERYQLLGSFIVNRFELQESGGLKNHIAFEENPVRDSVFMYAAMSRYRETAVHINHFYRTGFYTDDPNFFDSGPESASSEYISDSDAVDANSIGSNSTDTASVDADAIDADAIDADAIDADAIDADSITVSVREPDRRFVSLGRINHHFAYKRRSFAFLEDRPPSNFYTNTAIESANTYDSTFVHTIENQISWSNFPMQDKRSGFPFNFRIALAHRFVSIQQPIYANNMVNGEENGQYPMSELRFNQLIPGISIDSDKSRFLSFDAFTRLTVGGYNDEDLDIGGSVYIGRSGQDRRMQASALLSIKEAPYFSSNFSSNYIRWDLDFEKTNMFKLSTKLKHRQLVLHANYYLLKNAIYMNSAAFPEQNTEAFSVFTAGLDTQIGFGVFQSRHSILYQHTGSEQFERIPPVVTYHSIYADFSLFKKAMYTQIGFDILYNSPYKPMAYMPMIMHFYSQDVYESHFDFYLDAFLTAKIKRTRFFVKFQNILGLFASTPAAYQVPFYPLPEGAFKFGVSWMFFD